MQKNTKEHLRKELKNRRKQLSVDYQQATSTLICQRFAELPEYLNAKHLACYWAVNGEVEIKSLWIKAHHCGKQCYFPVIMPDETLQFYQASPTTPFISNKFNIPEPEFQGQQQPIALQQLDVIITPLLAFDDRGNRLGLGAGYYDRTLAQLTNTKNTVVIGVGYEFQHLASLPCDPWDIPLHYVLTEQQLYSYV